MRTRINIEIDRSKTIYEKQLEVILDIRDKLNELLTKQEQKLN